MWASGAVGTGNAGYCEMVQFSAPISQAAASASGGVTTQIVIPAQSMSLQFSCSSSPTAVTSGTTTDDDNRHRR